MKIAFFGTPAFAASILQTLLDSNFEIVAVVTQPDRPKGRGKKLLPPPVKARTPENIPLFQPEKASTPEIISALSDLKPDLFVVAAYGEIISQALLDVPTKGCINIHPSLLPKYRGATPIQSALLNGDTETGVTIIEMVKKMDAGPIHNQVTIPIDDDTTFLELEKKLCALSSTLLLETLTQIEKGIQKMIPQDDLQATYCSKISPEDRQIDWTKDATTLHNQIRALSPTPGAYTLVQHGEQTFRLKILKASKDFSHHGEPGTTLKYTADEWLVACGKGALALLEVQLEGKKTLEIKKFLRGYPHSPFFFATK